MGSEGRYLTVLPFDIFFAIHLLITAFMQIWRPIGTPSGHNDLDDGDDFDDIKYLQGNDTMQLKLFKNFS